VKEELKKTAARIDFTPPRWTPCLREPFHCIKLPSGVVNKLIESEKRGGDAYCYSTREEKNLSHEDREAQRCIDSHNFPVEAIRVNQLRGRRVKSRITKWPLHNPSVVVNRLKELSASLSQKVEFLKTHSIEDLK